MSKYYVLEGHEVKPVEELLEWARVFEDSNRVIARAEVRGVTVSTVFLGIDHSFGDGPPLLFETMVFGGEYDQLQERYSTYDEAVEGHGNVLRKVNHCEQYG